MAFCVEDAIKIRKSGTTDINEHRLTEFHYYAYDPLILNIQLMPPFIIAISAILPLISRRAERQPRWHTIIRSPLMARKKIDDRL